MAGLDPQSFVNLIAELLSDGALPSTARVELFTTFEHATYRFDAEIDKSKLPDSDSAEQWAAWQEKYGTPKKS